MRVTLRDYSPSSIAWITSLEIFFILGAGPIAGLLFDNYGPRWLLIAGSFTHVFGLMMASISTEYYQFLLSQGICSAIGASFIVTPAMSCVSTWFHKRRGLAMGLAAAGSSLGGGIIPIVVTRMLAEVGFPWAMRTCAFIILLLMIFANIFLKSRIPPTPRPFSIGQFTRPMREIPMILVGIAVFLFLWGMTPVVGFITAVANGRGMSLELAEYLVSVYNAGSIL